MSVRIKRSAHEKMQRAKQHFHALIVLFLIFVLSPLACTPQVTMPPPVTTTATQPIALRASVTPSHFATETSVPSDTQASSGPLTFIADADAQVRGSEPDTNFGDARTLRADGSDDSEIESFIRFTVTGLSDIVQSVKLRVFVNENGTENAPAIYTTDNSWTENDITWNNRPEPTSSPLDNQERAASATWVEYDISAAVTENGTFSFVLVADSDDGVVFSSREGRQPPQLVVTLGEGELAIASTLSPTEIVDGAILVGAGDISECDNDNDELTAQLLDAIPGTVFTTGDNAYSDGSPTDYRECYDPTWGRHKARTKPVPGNHEYHTSGASGYFQYFENIEPYYAYDLGDWRIYALNTEIDAAADSPQVEWLQADLAANPKECVLAYWHRPRWSSGTHHGNHENSQRLWQIMYQAGAEVVLNGHEHNYERFAPMNADGQPDPLGLREFVVGTGGRSLYEFGPPLPTSQVRNDTSYGVLKLILRESSYEWEFIPSAGSTFTDRGSTECH
jgi:hypothetical protein